MNQIIDKLSEMSLNLGPDVVEDDLDYGSNSERDSFKKELERLRMTYRELQKKFEEERIKCEKEIEKI
jgi:hypothetical protein